MRSDPTKLMHMKEEDHHLQAMRKFEKILNFIAIVTAVLSVALNIDHYIKEKPESQI